MPVPFRGPVGEATPRGRNEGEVGSGRSHRADERNATSGRSMRTIPRPAHPAVVSGDSSSAPDQENSANIRASMSLNAVQFWVFRYELVSVTTPTRLSGRKNILVLTP